jgi:transposase
MESFNIESYAGYLFIFELSARQRYADRILQGTKPSELPVQVRATKTTEQLDLQAFHRVCERFVSQRTGITNQIRVFLLERGIAVRQGLRLLRAELPRILATPPDVLAARMVRVISDLAENWRRLGERIDHLSSGDPGPDANG